MYLYILSLIGEKSVLNIGHEQICKPKTKKKYITNILKIYAWTQQTNKSWTEILGYTDGFSMLQKHLS